MSAGNRKHRLLACLGAITIAISGAAVAETRAPAEVAPPVRTLPPSIDDLELRTFHYFWDTADAKTGLIPDRYPTDDFVSVPAVGFALTAYAVGVERGYVSRAEAVGRTLATLRFFHDGPQGPEATGTIGYKGFFYRYLDSKTHRRWGNIELSSVDTALLLGGMLFAQSYYDRDTADEAEIRRLVEAIYRRVDWRWMQPRSPAIAHGWLPDIHHAAADLLVAQGSGKPLGPEPGFLVLDWKGYAEASLLYLLALGSPTHAVAPEAWQAWTSTYDRNWGKIEGYEHLSFTAMIAHHYSHVWVDFRGIQDDYMRRRGIDYFENSRRATLAQRAYAIANPMRWQDYGPMLWGFTACDGPTDLVLPYRGEQRRFRTYNARGVGVEYSSDDGTIAPTAIVASMPFAPEVVVPATEDMINRYGAQVIGPFGFFDAFNPSFTYDLPLKHGRVVPGVGWVDTDYIGVDQGPIVAMIENYRSDLVWRVMRKNPHLRRGLERAGFTGGWLDTASGGTAGRP